MRTTSNLWSSAKGCVGDRIVSDFNNVCPLRDERQEEVFQNKEEYINCGNEVNG